MVDARVDGFESRVQMRLDETQSTDMTTFQQELAKLKADLIASLAASITALEQAPAGEDLIDLFASADLRCTLRKRLIEENDAEEGHMRQRTPEENEELEDQLIQFVLQRSREEKE